MNVINVTADADVFTSNAYLVTGEVTTLVDVGAMEGVVDVVRDHTDDVDRVVLTHQHADHVEQLPAVLDAFDPEVCAYGDLPECDVVFEDGDAVTIGDREFDVVYTPGHAADHVAYVDERALFSGDVVVYNDSAFEDGSFGRTDMPGQSRERLIESLRTLLERMPETVDAMYAGHGEIHEHGEGGDTVREVVERALERASRREPKYPEA